MSRFALALLLRAAVPAGIAATVLPAPAQAQLSIVDVDSYANATRTLKIIDQQIQQLQNEAQMLRNQALNLAKTEFPDLSELTSRMQEIGQLIQQAKGVAFRASQVDQQFRQLYPDFDAKLGANGAAAQAKARLDTAMAGFQQTMKVQASIAENIETDVATLARLSERSQGASGALQVGQSTNQLLALATKQQLQIQQLLAAQFRADATDQARRAQAELEGHAAATKFLGSGTAYTPR
jgi:P-type conjugative transfer protein TrbJ